MKYRGSERSRSRLGGRAAVEDRLAFEPPPIRPAGTFRTPGHGRSGAISRIGVSVALALTVVGVGVVPAASSAAQLPDGYAYELATPQWTGGQRALVGVMNPEGTMLLFGSVGGFAGTENLMQQGMDYLARRTASGWETRPLALPGSEYVYLGPKGVKDYTDDLSRTLWVGTAAADVGTNRQTVVVRESDGSLRAAGPVVNDAAGTGVVVGTSADLNTVVFKTKDRPALTDGTVDARQTSRDSLMVAVRRPDGSLATRQVAFRGGATMFPTCPLGLGGSLGTVATSGLHAVSADGRRIFFTPVSGGPPPCNTAANNRVWMKEGTNDPIDLSATQCTVDCGVEQRAAFAGAARDGSRAYFKTEQKLVNGDQDTSNKIDLYEYDFERSGNKLIPVTISAAADGAGVLNVVRVSDDGSRVYFVANGRALAGANVHGDTPQTGQPNLYVYHRPALSPTGTTKFVGTLAAADGDLWAADVRRRIQVSESGRFAFFVSAADLARDRLPGDAFDDVFRFDAESGDLRRIWPNDPDHNGTIRSAGITGQFGKMTANNDTGSLQSASNPHRYNVRQFSDGGASLVFQTAERLSADDVNDAEDVYLWRADGDEFSMLSSGRSIQPAGAGTMSPSGDTITLTTADPLLPEHTSGAVATYVVRRGGGFASPPVPPASCRGDSCQGPLLTGPGVSGNADTSLFAGPGNVVPTAGSLVVKGSKRSRVSRLPLTVQVSGAGDVRITGRHVRRATRAVSRAGKYRVAVSLSGAARKAFAKGRRLRTTLRVTFVADSGETVVRRYAVSFQRGSRASAGSGKAKGGR